MLVMERNHKGGGGRVSKPGPAAVTFYKEWVAYMERTSLMEAAEGGPVAGSGRHSPPDMTTIIAELCAGFRTIDACFNTLTLRLDRMGERLDRQNVCLNGAEEHTSTLEYDSNTAWKLLENVEKILKTVAIKILRPGYCFEDLLNLL
ncbi:hypothetical protein NDU88_003535 [Pleurodeles waltl]|uniref:Uncharacterized protein n=1 Tax=Pleurodeles waltl TaxID=8319 RepID=A0AAV7TPF7_PLEWA|nr:hypothetical protein NDU88_003535 [Pleurodeles waltl]